MRANPSVIEVGAVAIRLLVKGLDEPIFVVAILIDANERTLRPVAMTIQSVDALMIVSRGYVWVADSIVWFPALMVLAAWHVRQNAEVIVERMILLHHDNNVIDLGQVAVRTPDRD